MCWSKAAGGYRFNCSNIGRIVLRQKIGHGVTKSVYLGLTGDVDGPRRRVAVKMVTRRSADVTRCLRQLPANDDRQRCFVAANMKLMKDVGWLMT